MSADPKQIESVFHRALAAPDRAAVLDAADPAVRERVEKLLAAHAELGGFLDGRDATAGYSGVAGDGPAVGTVIGGRYKLLEAIGEGGMGTVYMAEQTEPVRRRVALKLVKPGMDSKAVLARFEAERQALALMEHPNIARVLDAGASDDGRPFFVMELVKGTPITQFCDEQKLTTQQRLELFIPVCQAIQHAHQKGVIHRDIKPSNVLVALYDGHAVPKVIDFGVVKAAGQLLTEATLHTGFGAVVGTPEYMSPEQASFNNLDVDTRSDVYALGVLLYELLTGSTPVDKTRLKQAAVLEVLRVVREEEPPRPSVKLSTAEARAGIAATRSTDPGRLAKLLRGEIDWIVMRALEKDRDRRYDSAAGLARDVQRYLADEAVEARPPSAGYRARRFVRRNRTSLLIAWLVACMLTGWFATALNSKRRLEQTLTAEAHARAAAEEHAADAARQRAAADGQRRHAEASEKDATAVLGFLSNVVIQGQMDEFFKADPKDVTLRQALVQSEPLVAQFFRTQPAAEATVRYLIGTRVLGLGGAKDGEFAVRQLERALDVRQKLLGPGHSDTIDVAIPLAAAHGLAGHLDRGVKVLEQTRAAAPQPATDLLQEKRNLLTMTLADVYAEVGRYDDAVALLRELLALPAPPVSRAYLLRDLGQVQLQAGRPAEAEPVLREAVALLQKTDPADWVRYAVVGDVGASLLDQRKYAAAEPLLVTAYDELKRRAGSDLHKGPLVGDDYLPEAVDRLVRLYEATNRPEKAAEWRAKRVPQLAPPPRPASRVP